MNRRHLRAAALLVIVVWLLGLSSPAPGVTFPPGSPPLDVMPGTVVATIELLAAPGVPLPVTVSGPTIVHRSDPFTYSDPPTFNGQEAINTTMTAMDMTGTVDASALGAGLLDVELHLQPSPPNPASVGMIIDTNPLVDESFPAYSFFDIFFELSAPNTPLGALTLHNNDPLRMASMIDEIPPKLGANPYTSPGWIGRDVWEEREPPPYVDPKLQPLPLNLYDPTGALAGYLREHPTHSPEPGTFVLLGVGGLLLCGWTLIRRRRRRA